MRTLESILSDLSAEDQTVSKKCQLCHSRENERRMFGLKKVKIIAQDIFGVKKEVCTTCASKYIKAIKRLDKVANSSDGRLNMLKKYLFVVLSIFLCVLFFAVDEYKQPILLQALLQAPIDGGLII